MQSNVSIDEVQRLKDRLDRGERETQRFLDAMIHDVRAAQRAVHTSADLLVHNLANQMNEDTRRILGRLQDGISTINPLLAGVSSYSMSLAASQYSFGLVPVEIPVQAALAGLDELVQVTKAIVTHGPLPVIRGDRDRLTCLFRNLIANALTYRRHDPPRIDIHAQAGAHHWEFSVRDNGIGISPKYWGGLFTPFYRLHGPGIPGIGLGLSVCKNIVQAHGGTIWIDSEVDKFTAVFFTLSAEGHDSA